MSQGKFLSEHNDFKTKPSLRLGVMFSDPISGILDTGKPPKILPTLLKKDKCKLLPSTKFTKLDVLRKYFFKICDVMQAMQVFTETVIILLAVNMLCVHVD